jgi:hypothetical protein
MVAGWFKSNIWAEAAKSPQADRKKSGLNKIWKFGVSYDFVKGENRVPFTTPDVRLFHIPPFPAHISILSFPMFMSTLIF